MVCITSIAPKHINEGIQLKAVKSWIALGLKVFSFNNKAECELLKPLYPDVTFIETMRTMELTFERPYPMVNAVMDWCKEQEEKHFCIINSDIELVCDKETIERVKVEMENSIVMSNRVNHNGDYNGAQYLQGIDLFFIHKKWLSSFAQTIFCFGQCFWDYWIPFGANQKGIETTFVKQNIAYHLNHNAQYNYDQWLKTGRYFIWEFNLATFNPTIPKDIGKMNTFIYNYIYTNAKRKQI